MLDFSKFSHIPWRNLKKSRRMSKNLEESGRIWTILRTLKWSGKIWKDLEGFENWKILRKFESIENMWKNLRESKIFSNSLRLFFEFFGFFLVFFFEFFKIVRTFWVIFQKHHQKSSGFFKIFPFCLDCFSSLQILSDSCTLPDVSRFFKILLDSSRFAHFPGRNLTEFRRISKNLKESRRIWTI